MLDERPGAAGAPRRGREPGGQGGAARALGEDPDRRDRLRAQHAADARRAGRRRPRRARRDARALPATPARCAARRALPRERAAHRPPAGAHARRAAGAPRAPPRAGVAPAQGPAAPAGRPHGRVRAATATRSRRTSRTPPWARWRSTSSTTPCARSSPKGIVGDLVDAGTGRGGGAVYLRAFLDTYAVPDARVFVADRFRATGEGARRRPLLDGGVEDLGADLNQVREAFARFGLLDERVRFLQGGYPRHAARRADRDDRAAADRRGGRRGGARGPRAPPRSRRARRVRRGRARIRAGDRGRRRRVPVAAADRRADQPGRPVGRGVARGRRTRRSAARSDAPGGSPTEPRSRRPAPTDAIDLSVVVVFYDMAREAARTLHSLSRSYQEGIDDLDVRGDRRRQRLASRAAARRRRSWRASVRSSASSTCATTRCPSPTHALNRAVELARGRAFAFMIDGAHLLTPGVLRFGMAGLRTYDNAVVATQQWYVGPGPAAADGGPRLRPGLRGRAVPAHRVARRRLPAVRDQPLHRRPRLVRRRAREQLPLRRPRRCCEQVGAFDDSFSMPGGGYANLDLWERLARRPDATMVTILGEGSFHQLHGGTTTNDPEHVDRRTKIFSYGEHYRDLRGRHDARAGQGDALRRQPAGRQRAPDPRPAHDRADVRRDPLDRRTRRRARPVAEHMPDEQRTALIEAYWRGLSWQDQRVARAVRSRRRRPDLLVYQEIVASVRPEWIVETGTRRRRAARSSSRRVCELLGHGQCGLGRRRRRRASRAPASHLRVRAAALGARARRRSPSSSGDQPNALVILGSRVGTQRLLMEFERYAPLVPVGSYVVFENTIVNGRPVWPGYGAGPVEAVQRILVARRRLRAGHVAGRSTRSPSIPEGSSAGSVRREARAVDRAGPVLLRPPAEDGGHRALAAAARRVRARRGVPRSRATGRPPETVLSVEHLARAVERRAATRSGS